ADAYGGSAGSQAGADIRIAVIVLAGEQVETQAAGCDELELRPSATGVNGKNVARADDRESLADAGGVEMSDILAGEEEPGEFDGADRFDQPIHGEDAGGH